MLIIDFKRKPQSGLSLTDLWVVEGFRYGRPFRGYFFGPRERVLNKALHSGMRGPFTIRPAHGPDGKEIA